MRTLHLTAAILSAALFLRHPSLAEGGLVFDHSAYAKVLQVYVTNGRVEYSKLKQHREDLDDYVKSLANLSKEEYSKMSRNEKIAFWINTYNASATKLVVDHYPLRKRLDWKALAFPENSIQQIPHVWDRKVIEFFGKKISLDEIEHEILRKEFQEPRIHFALVCASLGCPALRGEPFEGDRLDFQLNDQVKSFLANPQKVRYDASRDTLFLSPVFKWFEKDFKKSGGVFQFVKNHLPVETADKISDQTKIEWLGYDWSLNENKNS